MNLSPTIFVFGVIGAAAPEILRLYNLRHTRVSWTTQYVWLSVPFYLLGGILAIALSAANPVSAIYIGIGTPLIINTAAKSVLHLGNEPSREGDSPGATIFSAPTESLAGRFFGAL